MIEVAVSVSQAGMLLLALPNAEACSAYSAAARTGSFQPGRMKWQV